MTATDETLCRVISAGRFISRGKGRHATRVIDSYELILVISGGVTKLVNLPFETKEDESIENLRKMFLAMSKDLRVISGKAVLHCDQGDVPDSGIVIAEFPGDVQHPGARLRGDLRGTAEHPRDSRRGDRRLSGYGSNCRFHQNFPPLYGAFSTIAAIRMFATVSGISLRRLRRSSPAGEEKFPRALPGLPFVSFVS